MSIPTEFRARRSGVSKVNNFRTIWSNLLQTLSLYETIEPASSTPFWLLLILLAVFHFATLQHYPPPFVDEGWFGSRAWSFHLTHRAFGPLDRGVFDRFPGYWTYFPWFPALLQSWTFIGSEQPTIGTLRIMSILFGLLLLIALYSISRRLAGPGSALLGVLAVALSPVFLYSAHLARYDIFAAALGFSAIALSFSDHSSNYWRHTAAGLLSVAAFEVHPYGCIYTPVCLIVYFLHHRWKVLKTRSLWFFLLGTACGLVAYCLLHLVRYPATWMALNQIAGSRTHIPPLFSGSLTQMYNSFQGVVQLAFYLSPFLISGFVLTLIYLAGQNSEKDRVILVLLLVFVIIPALILRNKFTYYAVLYVPFLELSSAYLLFRTRHPVLRYLVILLMVSSLAYGLLRLKDDQTPAYEIVQSRLARVIKPGEVVMGNQLWWFGLYKQPWYSWEELYYFRQFKKSASLEEAFLEFRPQILIIDAHLSFFIRQNSNDGSYFAELSLPSEELEEIFKKYGEVRDEFDGGYYGKIRILEFRWNRSSSIH